MSMNKYRTMTQPEIISIKNNNQTDRNYTTFIFWQKRIIIRNKKKYKECQNQKPSTKKINKNKTNPHIILDGFTNKKGKKKKKLIGIKSKDFSLICYDKY